MLDGQNPIIWMPDYVKRDGEGHTGSLRYSLHHLKKRINSKFGTKRK